MCKTEDKRHFRFAHYYLMVLTYLFTILLP